jgi:hypothetical protein
VTAVSGAILVLHGAYIFAIADYSPNSKKTWQNLTQK